MADPQNTNRIDTLLAHYINEKDYPNIDVAKHAVFNTAHADDDWDAIKEQLDKFQETQIERVKKGQPLIKDKLLLPIKFDGAEILLTFVFAPPPSNPAAPFTTLVAKDYIDPAGNPMPAQLEKRLQDSAFLAKGRSLNKFTPPKNPGDKTPQNTETWIIEAARGAAGPANNQQIQNWDDPNYKIKLARDEHQKVLEGLKPAPITQIKTADELEKEEKEKTEKEARTEKKTAQKVYDGLKNAVDIFTNEQHGLLTKLGGPFGRLFVLIYKTGGRILDLLGAPQKLDDYINKLIEESGKEKGWPLEKRLALQKISTNTHEKIREALISKDLKINFDNKAGWDAAKDFVTKNPEDFQSICNKASTEATFEYHLQQCMKKFGPDHLPRNQLDLQPIIKKAALNAGFPEDIANSLASSQNATTLSNTLKNHPNPDAFYSPATLGDQALKNIIQSALKEHKLEASDAAVEKLYNGLKGPSSAPISSKADLEKELNKEISQNPALIKSLTEKIARANYNNVVAKEGDTYLKTKNTDDQNDFNQAHPIGNGEYLPIYDKTNPNEIFSNHITNQLVRLLPTKITKDKIEKAIRSACAELKLSPTIFNSKIVTQKTLDDWAAEINMPPPGTNAIKICEKFSNDIFLAANQAQVASGKPSLYNQTSLNTIHNAAAQGLGLSPESSDIFDGRRQNPLPPEEEASPPRPGGR